MSIAVGAVGCWGQGRYIPCDGDEPRVAPVMGCGQRLPGWAGVTWPCRYIPSQGVLWQWQYPLADAMTVVGPRLLVSLADFEPPRPHGLYA